MPKALLTHANERIDKVDLDYAAQFGRACVNMDVRKVILDQQDRIAEGFRIELPNQTTYPGRLVIHGGVALARDGQLVFTEDQLDITRDITLEGANTWFYLEIEFFESDADVDARAFWDATVDQGTDPSGDPKPHGQEFFANVATRKYVDWRIVQPVSTTGFERDAAGTASSLKLPLYKLRTDVANQITTVANPGLTTTAATTVLLETISTSIIRVQNASLFSNGQQLIVEYNGTTPETVTIATVDIETGVISLTGPMASSHNPGVIVRATGVGIPVFIDEAKIGRYRRPSEPNTVDFRDRLYQGDEAHGDILSRGFNIPIEKSDLNVKSLKDYVDFLAAQIAEMRWGCTNPWATGTANERIPPGLSLSLPATPRYYDRSGGIMGARTAAVTVGDGVASWGDFNGATQAAIQKAHDSLPAAGGRIFLKRGTYILSTDFDWTSTGAVTLEGESGTIIQTNGGSIHVATTGAVSIRNLTIRGGASNIGIFVDTSNPVNFSMDTVLLDDELFYLNSALPGTASFKRVWFWGVTASMSTLPLFRVGLAGTVSGTFSECDFNHLTRASITSCSLIDCVTSLPTLAMSNANFVDCSFSSTLLNAESVNLGATANTVHFDRCIFWSFLTVRHVKLTGGRTIKFTNCVGTDAVAGFLYGSGATHIEVSGYSNVNSVGFSAIELLNCSDVKIRNCDVKSNSGASLSGSAIKLTSTSSGMSNLLVENCTLKGDTTGGLNKPTGIIFDLNGGTSISGVRIVNNSFDSMETGVYFANSGAAAVYQDIVVDGNHFYDFGGGLLTALNQKLGVLFGIISSRRNISVSGNTFENINPATTNLVSGVSRTAICFLGTANDTIQICNNNIRRIGSATFEVSDTEGIYIASASVTLIKNNIISSILGKGAFGIQISGTFTSSEVSNNSIYSISTVAGGSGIQLSAYGIYATNLSNVAINSNDFSTISTASASIESAAIGVSNVLATWENVSIVGNSLNSSIDTTSFLALPQVLGLYALSAVGNTSMGDSRAFVEIVGAAGGTIYGVSIVGNSAQNMTVWGIAIDAQVSSVYQNVAITGNTVVTATGKPLIMYNVLDVSVTGNTFRSNAAADDIDFTDVLRVIISSNVCKTVDGVGVANIRMSTGCRYYQINDNICDLGGGSTGATIVTTASAVAASGEGHVYDNLIDDATNQNANDDSTYGNGPAY